MNLLNVLSRFVGYVVTIIIDSDWHNYMQV